MGTVQAEFVFWSQAKDTEELDGRIALDESGGSYCAK
jgi:hypothetical protein